MSSRGKKKVRSKKLSESEFQVVKRCAINLWCSKIHISII